MPIFCDLNEVTLTQTTLSWDKAIDLKKVVKGQG